MSFPCPTVPMDRRGRLKHLFSRSYGHDKCGFENALRADLPLKADLFGLRLGSKLIADG